MFGFFDKLKNIKTYGELHTLYKEYTKLKDLSFKLNDLQKLHVEKGMEIPDELKIQRKILGTNLRDLSMIYNSKNNIEPHINMIGGVTKCYETINYNKLAIPQIDETIKIVHLNSIKNSKSYTKYKIDVELEDKFHQLCDIKNVKTKRILKSKVREVIRNKMNINKLKKIKEYSEQFNDNKSIIFKYLVTYVDSKPSTFKANYNEIERLAKLLGIVDQEIYDIGMKSIYIISDHSLLRDKEFLGSLISPKFDFTLKG